MDVDLGMSETKKKIKVEIVTPAGTCACAFSRWIEKVFRILLKYKDFVDLQSITSDSPRARELGVGGCTIVVNGEETPVHLLEQKIQELLVNFNVIK